MVTVTQKFTVRVASTRILGRLLQDKFQPIQLLEANSIGADGEYEAGFSHWRECKGSPWFPCFLVCAGFQIMGHLLQCAASSLHICFSHLAFRLDSQRTWLSRRPLSVAFYWPIYSRWENTYEHTHENTHENANLSKARPGVGRGNMNSEAWTATVPIQVLNRFQDQEVDVGRALCNPVIHPFRPKILHNISIRFTKQDLTFLRVS